MKVSFKSEDFTPHGLITDDVIKCVLENVEDFAPRYYLAMKKMDFLRCNLDYADIDLSLDIRDTALLCFDWYEDNIPEVFYVDLEKVFG